jgi:hypothetical protein
MTYKEIIDIFKQKVQGHFFVNTFGYGDISDIMTPDSQEAPYYPYIFLNPVSVSATDRISSFNFNLICMTQSLEDETSIMRKQSDCIENLKDIIARVNNTLIDPQVEIQQPFTFTPFKERFQDDVVGASCNLTVTYPTLLDACVAPIADPNYCLVARDFSTTLSNEFNATYTFGGWGYWKYVEEEYKSGDISMWEWVCDTRYGYYVSTEPQYVGTNPYYPMMSYWDTGTKADETRPNGYYMWRASDGTTFECGAKSSFNFYVTDIVNAVSYANTTNDNGWIIPDEGWVKTFQPDSSQDRTGNVYIFKTDCSDPQPKPTAAPVPPPSNTPTPTTTPTPSVSITPSVTVTPSITPSVTSTVTPSVTPSITSTVTPSITPSVTTTPSTSVTATPSATPSITVTPSISVSVTPSITPSITTSVTPTLTPTSTVTPTATVTPTITPSPSPVFYHIEAQNGDLIITQGGDFIDWFPL